MRNVGHMKKFVQPEQRDTNTTDVRTEKKPRTDTEVELQESPSPEPEQRVRAESAEGATASLRPARALKAPAWLKDCVTYWV